jgi:hypothetical protein
MIHNLAIAITPILIFFSGVLVQKYTSPKTPHTLPAPASPSNALEAPGHVTRNERWMQEQEHTFLPATHDFQHKNCRVCGPGPLRNLEVPSAYDHEYLMDVSFSDGYGGTFKNAAKMSGPQAADVVSSKIEGSDYHTLMLDIDLPARLLESSTPGHYHLYIDKPITWRRYRAVLQALSDAGVIEEAFFKAARINQATHLRVPWKEKPLS